eukprot:352526-Chlamydomonas_euryale.AAC.4
MRHPHAASVRLPLVPQVWAIRPHFNRGAVCGQRCVRALGMARCSMQCGDLGKSLGVAAVTAWSRDSQACEGPCKIPTKSSACVCTAAYLTAQGCPCSLR